MNCPVCGVANEPGAVFCYRCGSSLSGPTSTAQPAPGQVSDLQSVSDWGTPSAPPDQTLYERASPPTFGPDSLEPVASHGGAQVYQAPPMPPSQPYVVAAPPAFQQTSTLATVSLILGIVSFVFAPFIAAIGAVITGHMGRNEVRASGGRLSGEGMAMAGLILGYLNLAISLLVFVAFCMLFAAAGA